MTESEVLPVVLVPGLLCDRTVWAAQLDGLRRGGWLCAVADVTVAPSIDAMAARLLDLAPDRFHLAGLSMGGYVALSVARQAPGRVATLSLLGTSARPDAPEQTDRRHEQVQCVRDGRFDEVIDALLPAFLRPAALADDGVVADVRAMARRVGEEAFVTQQHAIMHRPDVRPALPAIGCPTMGICGVNDTLNPPNLTEEIVRLVPAAEMVLVEDCGHLSTMEAPRRVTDTLCSWLRQHAPEPSGRSDEDRTEARP